MNLLFGLTVCAVCLAAQSHVSCKTYGARYGQPYDSHSKFHHNFEHVPDMRVPLSNQWKPIHRPVHINTARKSQDYKKHRIDESEQQYWKEHHPPPYELNGYETEYTWLENTLQPQIAPGYEQVNTNKENDNKILRRNKYYEVYKKHSTDVSKVRQYWRRPTTQKWIRRSKQPPIYDTQNRMRFIQSDPVRVNTVRHYGYTVKTDFPVKTYTFKPKLSEENRYYAPVTPPRRRRKNFLECTKSCKITSEYDPVCGTNNVTYTNPLKLKCAKDCGIRVELQSHSRCGAPVSNKLQKIQRPVQKIKPQSKSVKAKLLKQKWQNPITPKPRTKPRKHTKLTTSATYFNYFDKLEDTRMQWHKPLKDYHALRTATERYFYYDESWTQSNADKRTTEFAKYEELNWVLDPATNKRKGVGIEKQTADTELDSGSDPETNQVDATTEKQMMELILSDFTLDIESPVIKRTEASIGKNTPYYRLENSVLGIEPSRTTDDAIPITDSYNQVDKINPETMKEKLSFKAGDAQMSSSTSEYDWFEFDIKLSPSNYDGVEAVGVDA